MKYCKFCELDKSIDEFSERSARCKLCQNAYSKKHYEDNKASYLERVNERNKKVRAENRAKLIEHLGRNPCVDCSSTDVEVLTFDHVNPTTKKYNVSQMLKLSWRTIQTEIDKCEVRCSNCHTKRTRRQFGFWTVEDT